MTGLAAVLRLQLRRDRGQLIIWAIATAAMWPMIIIALGSAMTDAARVDLVRLAAVNPALLFVRGTPQGTDIGAVTWFSVAGFLGLLFAFMATFHAVRHTRAEEEQGRTEMIGAGVVHRLAGPAATALSGLIKVGLCGAVVLLGSAVTGLDLYASLVAALGLAGVGMTWLALGLLSAMIMPTARSAATVPGVLAGLAFVVRGTGDALGTADVTLTRVESAWPAWLSPIGWAQLAHPFSEPRPQVLVLFVPLLLILAVVVATTAVRRELGESMVRPRRARPNASRWLSGPAGLVARQQRGTMITWLVVAVGMGGLVGGVAPAVADAMQDNPAVAELIERAAQDPSGDPVIGLALALLSINGVLASVAAISIMGALHHDERAVGELLFALPLARPALFIRHVVLATTTGTAVVVLAAGTAAVVLAGSGFVDAAPTVLQIGAAMLPVVYAYLGLTALLVGVLPRVLTWLPWVLLFGLMLLGQFAPLFDGFDRLAILSPFHWVANPVVPDADRWPSVVMVAVAVGLTVAGGATFRRRDLHV
ncbi:ABC transporter permease [Propionibacteriaceae bacterium Y2011]